MKYSEVPLTLMMLFMLVYLTIGNPNNEIWSGLFFIVNYATQLILFKNHTSRIIRLGGISLTISILIFIVIKYFFNLKIENYYSLIPFTICLITLIRYEYVSNKR